ncbi:MAG: metal ABC transporter substrate-binding protein [Thermoleophilia bacterium]
MSTRRGTGSSVVRSTPVLQALAALVLIAVIALLLAGCGGSDEERSEGIDIVTTTVYLADITQSITGGRLTVGSLIPTGVDPHAFEPTPSVSKMIADSRAVILDISGLSPLLDGFITSSVRSGRLIVEAAHGLPGRATGHGDTGQAGPVDPHFWLDPVNVLTYVTNIRDALIKIDPEGAAIYTANATAYTDKLRELDAWIKEQVERIPEARRLLVTNHESFGYFADRYGFTVVGTVFEGLSAESAPSAQQVATLINEIRTTGAPAIFLETGSNADLAKQVAAETGVKVVTDLHTHDLGKEAPTYIDMMRWNVDRIVDALR